MSFELIAPEEAHYPKALMYRALGRLDAELSGEALRRALARRSPPPGLIFHTDRGTAYDRRWATDFASVSYGHDAPTR